MLLLTSNHAARLVGVLTIDLMLLVGGLLLLVLFFTIRVLE